MGPHRAKCRCSALTQDEVAPRNWLRLWALQCYKAPPGLIANELWVVMVLCYCTSSPFQFSANWTECTTNCNLNSCPSSEKRIHHFIVPHECVESCRFWNPWVLEKSFFSPSIRTINATLAASDRRVRPQENNDIPQTRIRMAPNFVQVRNWGISIKLSSVPQCWRSFLLSTHPVVAYKYPSENILFTYSVWQSICEPSRVYFIQYKFL